MSDRFRFRVWDTKDKEYLDPNYYECCYLLPDSNLHVGMTVYNGICYEYQVIPSKQLIVEQCTGLRDKNGTLIYEGDVVEHHFKDGTSMYKEVYYNIEFCRWYLRWPRPDLHSLNQYMFWDFDTSIASNLEVIDNIHERRGRK